MNWLQGFIYLGYTLLALDTVVAVLTGFYILGGETDDPFVWGAFLVTVCIAAFGWGLVL